MSWHRVERTAVANALQATGPGAPTCCAGWRTEHLAAHLVLRERSPLTAAGIAIPVLAGRTERVTTRTGDEAAATPRGYARLVGQVRAGPPVWSPVGLAGDRAQLVEMFVHTEDVRRGRGRGSAVRRTLPAGEQTALWATLGRTSPLLLHDSPVGLVLTDGERTVRARRPPASPAGGVPTGRDVVVRGAVGELVLFACGRSTVAEVELEGNPDAVRALELVRPR